MKIKLEDLDVALSEVIKDYSKKVADDSIKELHKTAEKILDYIKINCPRSQNKGKNLADSFIITEYGFGLNKILYISSATKSQIVHLIEFGFKHRGGTHVAGRPFLRSAYDLLTPQMLEQIVKIIERG